MAADTHLYNPKRNAPEDQAKLMSQNLENMDRVLNLIRKNHEVRTKTNIDTIDPRYLVALFRDIAYDTYPGLYRETFPESFDD